MPYKSRNITTRFGSTHVIDAGDANADPVVILHGAFSSAAGCWPLINELASSYRVFAPDAPRQLGKTEPFHLSSFSYDHAMWLTDVLDSLGIQRANFVGFSLGGWLTLKLAYFAPERISRVVLISPVGVVSFRLVYLLKAALFIIGYKLFSSETAMRKLARLTAGPSASNSVVEEFADAGGGALRNFYMLPLIFPVRRRTLQALTAPTLGLMGRFDTFCNPRAVLERLSSHLPDTQSQLIQDVGHAVFKEKPDLIGKMIEKFLGQAI